MDVTADPQSQGSLLLSHNEALAGIGGDMKSVHALKTVFFGCVFFIFIIIQIGEYLNVLCSSCSF